MMESWHLMGLIDIPIKQDCLAEMQHFIRPFTVHMALSAGLLL